MSKMLQYELIRLLAKKPGYLYALVQIAGKSWAVFDTFLESGRVQDGTDTGRATGKPHKTS